MTPEWQVGPCCHYFILSVGEASTKANAGAVGKLILRVRAERL